MPSFYTPHLTDSTQTLQITDEEFHHIAHVFRRKPGDRISLINGKGILASVCIREISPKTLTAEILSVQIYKKSSPFVAAAFPLLKNKHDALIVEKLTELGIRDFFPIITERTVRLPAKNTVEKFEKIVIAAAKQCDNAILPRVHAVQKLSELLENTPEYYKIAALETGKNQILTSVLKELSDKSLCFIIGPEGGFSAAEINLFRAKEIPAFTLGNHILRAETAAVATAAQIIGFFLATNRDYY
jgi:16S rRNA (uracil1498-N3)-methyltransferase